jgi:hypothetical protein
MKKAKKNRQIKAIKTKVKAVSLLEKSGEKSGKKSPF